MEPKLIPAVFKQLVTIACYFGWRKHDPIWVWQALRSVDPSIDEEGLTEKALQAYWKEHASEYPWAYHE